MPRPHKPSNPFRYFNSSPEVIRLVVLMYVRFPLSLRNVEGFAGLSWDYTGKRYNDFSLYSVSHFRLPSYASLSGQAGVHFGRYSASIYVRNLTDKRGITTYSQNGGYNYTGNATIIQPRTIGVKLTARY